MPQNLNPYIYSVRKLRDIAGSYDHIYQGIEFTQSIPPRQTGWLTKFYKSIRYSSPTKYHTHGFYYITENEDDDIRYTEFNPWRIAEYKADFDMALNGIGKGHWVGEIMEYKYYRNFSKYQRLVIADICGIPVEDTGIDYAFQLHGRAYGKLKRFLNKTDEFHFVAKCLTGYTDNRVRE